MKILQHHDVVTAIVNCSADELPHVHVQLEPIEVYNFRFMFCHWHDTNRRNTLGNFYFTGKRSMDFHRLLQLIDELKECVVSAIAFTRAGDPFVYKGLNKVLKEIILHGIKLTVTSNFLMPLSTEIIHTLTHASWLRWNMNFVVHLL